MRRHGTTILTALIVTLSLVAPAVTAQDTPRIGPEDVNDEPNAPGTTEKGVPGNGFKIQGPSGPSDTDTLQSGSDGPPLILESYYEYDTFGEAFDINQLVNRAQHGDSYDDYQYFIYPGFGYFGVYWGWFADKGDQVGPDPEADRIESSRESFKDQSGQEAPRPVRVDEGDAADGVIFDDWDQEEDPKDEFVWHGRNPWANLTGHDPDPTTRQAHSGDTMFAFVQPGTYEDAVNGGNGDLGPYGPSPVNQQADGRREPDFQMSDRTNQEDQSWVGNSGFPAMTVGNSLFITTNVTMATNPPSTGDFLFNPTPDDAKKSGDQRYDIDIYQSVNPTATELYRTTVWDPNDQVDSPADAVHPNATKGLVKKVVRPAALSALGNVSENVSQATEAIEPQQGFGNDRVLPPFPHEPNVAGDDGEFKNPVDGDAYPHAPPNHKATYGGLSGDYYKPQSGAATYDTYEKEEHAWLDAYGVTSTNIYGAAIYGSGGFLYTHPDETPTKTGADEGQRAVLPGQFTVNANFGTWLDTNGDSFVGGADDGRSHPYQNGTVDDPNQYGDDEFRGTCGASWTIKVYPHDNDPDNDGTDEWGTVAFRVHNEDGRSDDPVIAGFDGHPYPELVGDATGGVGPVQDGQGEARSYFRTPGDEKPIPLVINCQSDQTGNWDSPDVIDFPTGSLTHGLKVVTTAKLTDSVSPRPAAQNSGSNADLQGETITDVDIIESYELG